jgi:T5SS/PEP-CTERM-associated repeat protein
MSGFVYSWTGHVSNSFDTIGNWYNDSTGSTATALPGSGDEALVSASGLVSGSLQVDELALTGTSGGLTLTGNIGASYAFVGGNLTLASGASLGAAFEVDIGDNSAASLAGHVQTTVTVGAGASLGASQDAANMFGILVGQYGGSGTLVVGGAGATVSAYMAGIVVGNQGNGLISVTAGGHISAGIDNGSAPDAGLALGLDGGTGGLSLAGAGAGATFGNIVEIGWGGTGAMLVANGATLTAGDGANSLTLGDSYNGLDGAGYVSVVGATLTLSGVIDDGTYGTGDLSLGGGAVVNVGSTGSWSAVLGATAGSSGTLAIASGARMTAAEGLVVGSVGSGTLSVTGGTLVIQAAQEAGSVALDAGLGQGSSGIITVTGGLLEDINRAGVVVGSSGKGVLSISGGGTLSTGGAPANFGLTLGFEAGASGSASVTGSASLLSVAGGVDVGFAGSGTLSVSNGASLSITAPQTVTGLALGDAGGSGAMTVATGAHVSVTGQADIGSDASATLSVTGGSSVTVQTSGDPALVMAVAAGVVSTVLISDADTSVVLTGGLIVGDAGDGNLTLQNGAALTVSSASANTLPGVVVAALAGASSLTVTGAGTRLIESGQFQVGGIQGTGGGTLTISAGASVQTLQQAGQTIPGASIGDADNALACVADVTGAGSSWSIAGSLEVGANGRALLEITSGGHVTAGTVADGGGTGSFGTILVSGAGAVLSTGALSLGGADSRGNLSILSGGTVTASGPVSVTGSVSLGGGTLTSAGTLSVSSGSSITGQGRITAHAIIDQGSIGLSHGSLSCIGAVTGAGTLGISGGGDLVLAGTESHGVGIAFGSGGGTLTTGAASAVAGTITGWSAGDVIDLHQSAAVSGTFANGTLSLFGSTHQALGALLFSGTLATHNFTVTQVAGEGAVIAFHT